MTMVSEISSLQATAIAQGQLDPSTMKGFNELPSSNCQLKRTSRQDATNAIRPPNRLLKQETTPTSCFTIVSSQKTGTKRITVMEKEPGFDKTKPMANLEDERCLSDTSNLEKLISPLKKNILCRVDGIPAKRPSTVPDNNPFKRRKETVAVKECVNEVEELELICISPAPATQTSVGVETKHVAQQSVVTEVEDLEILCITPDSQKSVESKPVKKTGQKKRASNERIPESNKNTILNFFSRV